MPTIGRGEGKGGGERGTGNGGGERLEKILFSRRGNYL